MEKKSFLKGYFLIFMAGVFWGLGGYFVTRMSNMGVSSLMAAFPGHFLALLPLLIYLVVKKGISGLKFRRRVIL